MGKLFLSSVLGAMLKLHVKASVLKASVLAVCSTHILISLNGKEKRKLVVTAEPVHVR
jgi:hypothetical protein